MRLFSWVQTDLNAWRQYFHGNREKLSTRSRLHKILQQISSLNRSTNAFSLKIIAVANVGNQWSLDQYSQVASDGKSAVGGAIPLREDPSHQNR